MRLRLNCIIVAWWLWLSTHGHGWYAKRRSVSFHGMILHRGVFAEGDGVLYLTEYVPPDHRRKQHVTDRGDSMCLFRGVYRIHRYRFERSAEGESFDAAARELSRIA